MTNTQKTLILVDGSSYLYRAFHALPPLTNSKGQTTGAIFGVINMLRKLKSTYKSEHMAVVFDSKGKTKHHQIYAQYKANRPTMPDELSSQVPFLWRIIEAMGWPLIRFEGIEADDIIGTLTCKAIAQGWQIVISTGDKDFAQLVSEQVTLVNTMTNQLYDHDKVIEKFGVPPHQIIDYLALIGDSVDNVPGIPKVGPKTATKWLSQYHSLENIIEHANDFSGKVGENLRENLDFLPIAKQLVTIDTQLQLDLAIDALALTEADTLKLTELYHELEFKSLLEDIQKQAQDPLLPPKTESSKSQIVPTANKPLINSNNNTHGTYLAITETDELDRWLTQLAQAKLIAIDTETTSLDYMDAELVGISMAVNINQAIYIPLGHDQRLVSKQLDKKSTLAKLKPILENPNIAKVGHNIKYDLNIFSAVGIELRGVKFDTMIESFLMGNERNNLDAVALKYLHYQTIKFEDVAGKGSKQITFDQVPLEEATKYAAEDADVCLKIHQLLSPSIHEDNDLNAVFQEVEMPLVPILAQIERNGVLIDAQKLNLQSQEIAQKLLTLERLACNQAGESFNLSSPKQLQTILYQKMALPIIQKTPKGQPSTAENVLQELARDYPLADTVLRYRTLAKLKSTYLDKLPLQINKTTGRVHTSYHQVGAITGRFSSTDPNLQNIPIRTQEGRRIRQAFIASPEHSLISADYSQIELRIMAHFSQDKALIDAFNKNLDIHSATAAEVLNIPLEQVSSEQRRNAKAINFGLIYGMSAFGLSKQLGITRESAQNYIDRYFERYPGVKNFMANTRDQAINTGYVKTLLGRKMYLPGIQSNNHNAKKAAERAAINAPMQGSAADIIKKAIINMHHALLENNCATKIIMQVHDELVFEVPNQEIQTVQKLIKIHMPAAGKLAVPLVVDIGMGEDWDRAHS